MEPKEDARRLVVGVAVVDDDRLQLARQVELGLEQAPLTIGRCVVAEEIEARLPTATALSCVKSSRSSSIRSASLPPA